MQDQQDPDVCIVAYSGMCLALASLYRYSIYKFYISYQHLSCQFCVVLRSPAFKVPSPVKREPSTSRSPIAQLLLTASWRLARIRMAPPILFHPGAQPPRLNIIPLLHFVQHRPGTLIVVRHTSLDHCSRRPAAHPPAVLVPLCLTRSLHLF